MNAYKIIFTGPVGAGKTTSIDTVSDIPPIHTDQNSTEKLPSTDILFDKQKTTVAMDYGMMRLDNGELIHLYGTPSQQRFEFMWNILMEGSLGVVLLSNNSSQNPLDDLRVFLDAHQELIAKENSVIGVTHMDESPIPTLDDYYKLMLEYDLIPAIFEADANKAQDIKCLVSALLFSLDSELVE